LTQGVTTDVLVRSPVTDARRDAAEAALAGWSRARLGYLAALFALVLALRGAPVPSGNELVYLLAPWQVWHPGFLQGDWTFARPWPEHWVFNNVIGALTLVLPLPVFGWVGRLACWALGLLGLLRLGRRFGLSDGAATLAIALWLAIGQTILAADWMFKTFEAKSVAYVFLLFAIDRYLAGRERWAAALLGLCFSFHPSVGASAALGFGAVLLLRRTPWKELAGFVAWTFIWSLPGLIPLLPSLAAGVGNARETWRFMVEIRMATHLDPARFERRAILCVYLLFGFSWLHAASHREDRALQFSRGFLLGLALLFTGGLAARAAGWWQLLQVFPFRVFPLLAPLFFFFHACRAYADLRTGATLRPAVLVLGLIGLMTLKDPLGGISDQVYNARVDAWPDDDLGRTFEWIAGHTPEGTVAILPPWRKDTFYRTQRGQVVNWDAVRYDQTAEWRARMEALCGPLDQVVKEKVRMQQIEDYYDHLSQQQVEDIASRYGGSYLVSRASYPFPIRFTAGQYRVYEVGAGSSGR
jgi:hypothetical protein